MRAGTQGDERKASDASSAHSAPAVPPAAEAEDSEVPRGRGTAKLARPAEQPWNAFFNAEPVPTATEPLPLPLEDAKDAVVKAGDEPGATGEPCSEVNKLGLFSGDSWRNVAGPDGKIADERVSHLICRVLRYHTETLGLTEDEDGYVDVADLVGSMPELENTTEDDIRRVVKESVGPKGARFELREGAAEDAAVQIRATYKHPKDGRRLFGPGRGYRHPRHFGPLAYSAGHPAYQRPGFSRPPGEHDDWDNEEGEWPPRLDSGPSRRLALGEGPPAGERAEASRPDVSRQQGAAASAYPADADKPIQERWERYLEPETFSAWFWNAATDEVFYADDAESGWERFEDSAGRPWWWNEARNTYFFEEAE